jgi:hypothetical protein
MRKYSDLGVVRNLMAARQNQYIKGVPTGDALERTEQLT